VKTDIPAQAGGIGSNLCTGVRAFGFAKSIKRPADRLSSSSCRAVLGPIRFRHRPVRPAGATGGPVSARKSAANMRVPSWIERKRKRPSSLERGLQGLQRRRRRSLFRSHGRPDAGTAQADAGRWRLREGREKPPRQDRSRGHGRRIHRTLAEGPDGHRLFERCDRGAQGRHRLRQGHEKFVILGGAMGKTAWTRTASRRSPRCRRSTNCAQADRLAGAPATKIAQLTTAPAAKLARVVQAYASKGEAA